MTAERTDPAPPAGRIGSLAGREVAIACGGPDATAVAALVAGDGGRPRHGPPAPGDDAAAALGGARLLVVDEWTAETDAQVLAARAAGVRVTVLAELLLERMPCRVLAVTGTAGKTTATRLAAAILAGAGVPVLATHTARAGNAWPDHGLLGTPVPPGAWLAAELTSTHLCHIDGGGLADVAVLTCLWPDHVELHGSPEAYAAAKRRLFDRRRAGGWAVLPAGDGPGLAMPGGPVAGPVARFSASGEVALGAWAARGRLWARWDGPAVDVGPAGAVVPPAVHPAAALAACAAALACGAPPESLADGLRAAPPLPHRLRVLGTLAGTPLVDDAMAATPAKAAAALARFGDRSVVLVAGGDDRPGGLAVHDHPAERALLARACAEAARASRAVVLFGPAAHRLAPHLAGLDPVVACDLPAAVAAARRWAPGAAAVLVAPMFPVAQADREALAGLVDPPTAG
jgi:UDP-N-acetylmuramoylalanine--D-glutamate ligase